MRPRNPQQTPYINHPLAVARILAEVGIRDLSTLQAALLHDTLEDTEATRPELDAAFGGEVGELVASLTDDEDLQPLPRDMKREGRMLRLRQQKYRQLRTSHCICSLGPIRGQMHATPSGNGEGSVTLALPSTNRFTSPCG